MIKLEYNTNYKGLSLIVFGLPHNENQLKKDAFVGAAFPTFTVIHTTDYTS